MKRKRFFEVTPDQILVGCIACGSTKDSGEFYVKYKRFPPTSLSHWQEKCQSCAKKYRTRHYQENADKVNADRKVAYYANHEVELKKSRDRKLANSPNPKRLQQRRAVQKLPPDARYIHDRCIQWKAQAERRGFQWLLDEKAVLNLLHKQKGLCRYSRQPLVLAANHRDTLSIDRIDSARGYEPDNVALCGAVVNKMKLNMSLSDFREIVKLLHDTL
jgi:hypothetical protein